MTTLRQILKMIDDDFLDAELTVNVFDGYLNSARCEVKPEFAFFPRSLPVKQTGEPARLTIRVFSENHRLVKIKGTK